MRVLRRSASARLDGCGSAGSVALQGLGDGTNGSSAGLYHSFRAWAAGWSYLLILAAALLLPASAFAGQDHNLQGGKRAAEETLSLDGIWNIAFDPENSGKAQRWCEHFPVATTPIRVPSVWNEIRPNYQGVAWYQTSFQSPAHWQGMSVRIGFAAVSYLAEVWLNGKYLGTHEGGYTPFELVADQALSGDRPNQLVVRVLLPMRSPDFMSGLKWVTGKRIDGFILEEIPASKQIWYDNFGGIWQNVQVHVTPRTWVQNCFVRPDIYAQKIDVTCDLINGTGQDQKITLALAAASKNDPATDEARQRQDVLLTSGTQPVNVSLKMPGAKLWSPDHPFLYTLQVELLTSAGLVDSRELTFGMRDFTIRENRFCLNGQPIIIKAAIYQPHYPQTLAYPPDPTMLATDIRLAKAAHLNMLRLHIKPQLPRLLELADEQGILLYEEPPIGWIQKSPQMRDRCRREVRELIARDRNHPSLVMWGALNEGAAEGEELKAELAAYAHELDPTRLVFDDSGGIYYSGENSRVYIPGSIIARPINDIHPYMLQPFSQASFNYYRQMQEPNLLNFTSEFGAMGGIEDLDAVIGKYQPGRRWQDKDRLEEIYGLFRQGFNELHLDKSFGDFAAFARSSREAQAEALTRMIDALRINPLTAGYDICHWNDASFEFPFGLVDEWRDPKPSYAAAAAANQPLHIIVDPAHANFYAGEPVEAELAIVNDQLQTGKIEINLEMVEADGHVLEKQTRTVALGARVQALGRIRLTAPLTEGSFKLMATMFLEGSLVDRTGHAVLVLKRPAPPAGAAMEASLLDPGGRTAARLHGLPVSVSNYRAGAPAQSVYVVGPIAESLYDYPLAPLKGLVELARHGATLVLLELPKDSGEVSEQFSLFPAPLKVGFPEGFKLQWIRAHAVTAGLPSNLVLNQRYSDILPMRFLEMPADEVVGGLLLDSFGDYHRRWFQSLVVTRLDRGHLIICQYRLLGNLGKDPLADRLFMNLLAYAQAIARRPAAPVGPERTKALEQTVTEERTRVQPQIQRWVVAGPFDNRGRAGLDRADPPEKDLRFGKWPAAQNSGVAWKPSTVWSVDGYHLNLGTRFDDWTMYYAYTQVFSPREVETTIKLTCQQGCRFWLNGKLMIDSGVAAANDNTVVPVTLHAGWNSVLVKVDRTKMQQSFLALNIKRMNGEVIPGLKFDFAGESIRTTDAPQTR